MAFTIVELLVVVVVIALLAAISLVVYSGISQKAVVASLQHDLSSASTTLKAFQAEKGNYPTTISTDCSASPDTATNKCIKLSNGNSLVGYSVNNQTIPKNFYLVASNNTTAYRVTGEAGPTQIGTTTQPGTTPGAVLELHATKANGGTSQGINSPSTSTWADTSESGRNALVTGTPAWTTDSGWDGAGTVGSPYAFSFDGTSDYFYFPIGTEGDFYGDFTVDVWFKRDVVDNVNADGIIGDWYWAADTQARDGWVLRYYPSAPSVLRFLTETVEGGTTIGRELVWDATAIEGTWIHAIVVNDFSVTRRSHLYVNGTWQAQSPQFAVGAVPKPGTQYQLRMGYNPVNGGYYDGKIASFRAYPFALTPTQITNNYNAGSDW